MTIRLLLRHSPPVAATLTFLLALFLVAGPASAQEARQAAHLQDFQSLDILPVTPTETQRGGGIVADPSFEAGRVPDFWTSTNPTYIGGSAILGPPAGGPDLARTGEWYAILGSGNGPLSTGIEQELTVEAGDYTIAFWLLAGINDGSTSEFYVEFNGEELVRFGLDDLVGSIYDGVYGLVEIPVTVEADGAYTLSFLQENDGAGPDPDFINFFIDDVSLTPSTGAITIAEARAQGPDSTVTIEGTVTRAKGDFTYIQDETAGLTIRQTSGAFFDEVAAGTITEGTELLLTGTLSEFRGLLQINGDDLTSYEVLGQGDAPAPQPVTLEELIADGEAYEAELVAVVGLTTDSTGIFMAASSYTVVDATATLEDGLRVPNADDSDVDSTAIPEGEFSFTGVVGQFTFDVPAENGYQLLAIEETDIDEGPPPVDEAIHDTGLVQFEVYDDGNLGTVSPAPFAGTGFVFDGVNSAGNGALFASTFVVGQSQDQVSGTAYESSDWVTVEPLIVAEPPEDFDQAFEASYDDSGAPFPLGIEVEQFSYSSTEAGMDGFVIVEFDVENTTDGDLENLYVGIFADWDVGTAVANLGGFDEETSTLYVYDDLGGDTQYYGVVALDDNVSGYNLDAGGGTNPTDEDLYNGMTTFFPIPELPADRRAVLGVGPYDIPAGETVTVQFAYAGGEDLDDLLANAAAAQGDPVAAEGTTPEGTFVLDSAYPNPFASSTTIGFTLPSAQDVKLTVYDVLGRRVATLVDGVRQAGEQSVRFDASSLPSGMYLYRLEAGGTQLTQRVTIVR